MKFRRKSGAGAAAAGTADETTTPADEGVPASGPVDAEKVGDDGVLRVDLGALLVPQVSGMELRLQVDEKSGAVRSVILAGQEGAMEFQAFAAPRNGELWESVRPQIAADLEKRGGSSEEREGRWGTELSCQMPVRTPEGEVRTQPSRIIGVNGSRWLLRATLLGKPAVDPTASQEFEDALAQVAVRRGTHAMPVGEALPVRLPDDARRMG